MQSSFWKLGAWKLWAAAVLSAGLLELPFPLAGPMPVWRSVFACFGLVPLLWALLSPATLESPRPLRRGFLVGYLCGVLWYMGNCYWVRDTMLHYGDMPPMAPTLLLIGYSLVLGAYFGLFGWGVVLVRRATGSTRMALAFAPFLWAALELAAARITSVPWDQLGYSQVDNTLVNQLAPWTGVYGISYVLVGVNALLTGGLTLESRPHIGHRDRIILRVIGVLLMTAGAAGVSVPPPHPAPTATAVLIQPNLDVGDENAWSRPGEWEQHIAEFKRLAGEQCKTYIAGIPQTGAPTGEIICPPYPTHPDLVVWPESPAPFIEQTARFEQAITSIARQMQAPLVVGNLGVDVSAEGGVHYYNSARIESADGARVGRYDKIHLVPFGEYIPFQNLLTFARKLTGRVSAFTRGDEPKVFRLPTANGEAHRYGVFICYESVFADEVRHFAQLGAEVLVNISDDGWYGDTSAPWQHLNMARMRAIENRRWLLRDTNSGVTAVIDPYGRVRQSIPRHAVDALPAGYGFRSDVTFYTAHGDVFAWACAILALALIGWSAANEKGKFMPIVKPAVSKEVLDEIAKAEGMHNFILATIPGGFVSDTDIKILVAALFSLTLEHHGAILHLLKAGQFDGSALTLVRPLIDGTYRAHWIYACAKPDIVVRIKNGENVYPGLINMATEVEKKSDAGGIFAAIAPYIDALHGYTHGGLEQLGRRFDAAGDVRPNYADGEKLEAIRATTSYITALAIAWCQLISTDAPDKEPRSKAISDRYIELYQTPSEQVAQ